MKILFRYKYFSMIPEIPLFISFIESCSLVLVADYWIDYQKSKTAFITSVKNI